jgi:hypothetical protein
MKTPIVLFLLLALSWTAYGAGQVSFQDYRDYLIGSDPLTIVLADVNKDTYPDAIIGAGGGTLVLLGRSDGTFGSPTTVQTLMAESVAVADFNNDGNLDIASLGLANGNLVNLALGNGNGTFQPARTLNFDCTSCTSIVAADFNNDGRMDIAAASTSFISIYLGTGRGSIFLPRPPSYPANFVTAMIGGDVDKDGNADLVFADFGAGTQVVMKGNGRGAFSLTSYPAGSTPYQALLVDINGDSWPDLISPDRDSNHVLVRLNLGNGTFGSMTSYDGACPIGTSCAMEGVTAGDFNKDGKLDIATPGAILYGNGNGTLQAPLGFLAGVLAKHVASADFNRDGYSDLIVGNEAAINVSVLFGGQQPVTQPLNMVIGNHPKAIVTGDFNGDNKPDLAVAVNGENVVKIYLGAGNATFTTAPALVATGPGAIVAKDLNHDNKLDLAISSYYGTWIYLGRGDGTFQLAAQYPSLVGDCTPSGFSQTPSPCLATGDFNGDNIPDLAGAVWINGAVSFLLGNGDGTFRPGPQSFVVADLPLTMVTGDFDKDSKVDLAIGSLYGNIYIYKGNGDGTFNAPSTITVGAPGAALSVGDIDADGNLDLVFTSGGSQSAIGLSIAVLFGRGNLTFNPPMNLLADMSPNAAVIDDFNGDGLLDIATANLESDDVSVFINNGNRTFQAAILFGGGVAPAEIVSADLTGDFKSDIVVLDSYGNATVLVNNTP